MAQLMGTSLHRTTAHNPAANGMGERTHRTLKAALMARCTGLDWKSQLPWMLLGLRTTPKEGLGVSSAEMVYGETIADLASFFRLISSQQRTSNLPYSAAPLESTPLPADVDRQ